MSVNIRAQAKPKSGARHPGFVAFSSSGCYYAAVNRFLVLCLATLALAGCQSHPFSVAVSPRLTGRVLAADTGQPLADVKVSNLDRPDDLNRTVPPKGGQRLLAKPPV